MSRYEIIGSSFGKGWPRPPQTGPVVVSAEAFFLVTKTGFAGKVSAEQAAETATMLTSGPLGILIGRWLEGLFGGRKSSGGRESSSAPVISGLPENIVRDPEWPVPDCKGKVVILPKPTVRSLHFDWKGYLCIASQSGRYKVPVGSFKKNQARETLAQLGWQV